jgi:hypothetical protein
MRNAPGDNQLPAAILGGVVADEQLEQETEEPESERLAELPEHENDRARGVDASIGAGVAGLGGTATETGESSDDRRLGPDETS